MEKIKSIWFLAFEGGEVYYEVGKNGITEIIPTLKNGQMAQVTFYKVFKGKDHYADVHQVTEIIWQEPKESEG